MKLAVTPVYDHPGGIPNGALPQKIAGKRLVTSPYKAAL
jgi:hypothetical protein